MGGGFVVKKPKGTEPHIPFIMFWHIIRMVITFQVTLNISFLAKRYQLKTDKTPL